MITESSKKCHFGIMPITTQQNFLNKNLIITESSKKYVIITISSRFFFFFSFFSWGGRDKFDNYKWRRKIWTLISIGNH